MATSNAFSRMLPAASGRSIYETIQQQEDEVQLGDESEEEALQRALEEARLEDEFQDEDLDRLLAEDAASRFANVSSPLAHPQYDAPAQRRSAGNASRPKWMRPADEGSAHSDFEDDVSPQHLLLDDAEIGHSPRPSKRTMQDVLPQPVPGPSRGIDKIRWDTQRPARSTSRGADSIRYVSGPHASQLLSAADPADKAMMRWSNVTDLDAFLRAAYDYYRGKGLLSIILGEVLSLCTVAFVVTLTVFLSSCVKYSAIPGSKHLDEVVIPQCTEKMTWLPSLILWFVAIGFIIRAASIVSMSTGLWHMRDFYRYLLDIPDGDMQTISWQEVVSRIMSLREQNPRTAKKLSSKAMRYMNVRDQSNARMDAHDIANRIMRKDNYLIALFNKDVLDLTIPLPGLRHKQLFTRSLQEVVLQSILDFAFNEKGQVKQAFLKDTERRALADALKRRFILNGFFYILVAPFFVSYYLFVYFLTYFKEFEVDPSQLSARRFTPFAIWKFREFNELDHFFEERVKKSYPASSRYIDQFPKDKTNQIARFLAFVFGSLTAVLATISLLDPDVFLGFELTPSRTVLFYITLFGGVWRVAHGMVPDDTLVYEPEHTMQEIIAHTHYQPSHWKNRLHSDDIRQEFSTLYKMKILIFLEEIMGMVVTPYILWFSLPNSAERIIDFFREFTVHVDGLGYVCWFAHFNFKNPGMTGGRVEPQSNHATDLREQYYEAKDGKMMSSYYNFLDSYTGNARRRGERHAPERHAAQTTGRRSSFRPPPAFPALNAAKTSTIDSSPAHDQPAAWSTYRSPPTRAATSQVEPPASLLLDPQHAPSPVIQPHRRPNAAGQSRYRPQRGPIGTIDELQDVQLSSPARRHDPETESAIIEQDSKLGDSWKGGPDDSVEESERSRDGGPARAEEMQGVLGLLYQFQQAQGGRGPGGGLDI